MITGKKFVLRMVTTLGFNTEAEALSSAQGFHAATRAIAAEDNLPGRFRAEIITVEEAPATSATRSSSAVN